MFCISTAHENLITDFTDDYEVSNWVVDNSQGGSVDLSNSPLTVSLIEPNSSGSNTEVTFLTVALTDFFVSFDWSYDTSFDACCSSIRFHGAAGGPVTVASGADFSGSVGMGTSSFSRLSGTSFGWGNSSTDSILGANILEISNVTFDVPEPSTLAIFAFGIIGLASRRFNKQYV